MLVQDLAIGVIVAGRDVQMDDDVGGFLGSFLQRLLQGRRLLFFLSILDQLLRYRVDNGGCSGWVGGGVLKQR